MLKLFKLSIVSVTLFSSISFAAHWCDKEGGGCKDVKGCKQECRTVAGSTTCWCEFDFGTPRTSDIKVLEDTLNIKLTSSK